MRVVIQRVSTASVSIKDNTNSRINSGFLILLGIEEKDGEEDAEWLCSKIANMRIFADDQGLMNRSLMDVQGDVLVVSQFTLHALTKKGNRPSFIKAARPEQAIPLYELFIRTLEEKLNKKIERGIFGADMQVSLINDGPVTIIMDSKDRDNH